MFYYWWISVFIWTLNILIFDTDFFTAFLQMTNEDIGLEPALESEVKRKKKKSPEELEKQRAALANANTSGVEKKKKVVLFRNSWSWFDFFSEEGKGQNKWGFGSSESYRKWRKSWEDNENEKGRKILFGKSDLIEFIQKKAKKNGDTVLPKVDQNGQKGRFEISRISNLKFWFQKTDLPKSARSRRRKVENRRSWSLTKNLKGWWAK